MLPMLPMAATPTDTCYPSVRIQPAACRVHSVPYYYAGSTLADAQRPTYSYWSPGTAAQHVNPVTLCLSLHWARTPQLIPFHRAPSTP
ncbi:hypothetical protein CCUS01_10836 [Colletotrichum cuscutae]|uniref:Uncharacterized protein n=1 Tax=Colletotrichum cuscutae TaxID=1209917 RepID=A0AAI9U6I9_9PEZI|nr:hypothetical protein CCUS01_10836 [Colletotrichum cuscutae]